MLETRDRRDKETRRHGDTETKTKPSPRPRVAAPPRPSGWLHAWAVVTVAATFVLLAAGSVVTTLRVGMADPVWPTEPWYLLRHDWSEPKPGFVIEHAHRAAGYVVGCCAIVLAALAWVLDRRPWLRWLATAALGMVVVQGLLGGFRVRLNALMGTDLAAAHGCFAQLVFAVLVGVALFTSRSWAARAAASEAVRRASLLLAGVAYLQVVFGAVVRHTHSPLGQRLHLLTAFAVVALLAWLGKAVWADRGARGLRQVVALLAALVAVQLVLGTETWISRYSSGTLPELQPATLRQGLLRTGHFLAGSLIFAATVAAALLARRPAPELRGEVPA